MSLTVKNLLNQLEWCLENNYLKPDDCVCILGLGDAGSGVLSSVSLPKVALKESSKKTFTLGFLEGEKHG